MWLIAIKEFKHKYISLLSYTLGSLFLLALYVAIYPSIKESAVQFQKVLEAYPKEFLTAFGVKDLTFNTLEKYLAAEQYSFMWPILAIALTLTRAGSSIAGEIEAGTMGLLLSLPVGRIRLFAAKYLAGIAALVIFVMLSVLGVIPMAAIAGVGYNLHYEWNVALLSLLFMAAVFGLSMFVSTLVSEKGKVYISISALLLLMYVMNVVAGLKDSLDWLKYGSYFYYYNVSDLLNGGGITTKSALVFIGTAAIATVLAAWRFNSRDIAV